ncbi:CHP02147 [Desulfonema limicola]|uniref:CHP02147 n=1 Tax=Desulfonema limicola TaxID=45656 RepID=A0A975B980_9BACT|nr:TIGR02147 family protein [Desulfonema limicola]QTA80987.1 CHP02147 [Desulfonema limicola]
MKCPVIYDYLDYRAFLRDMFKFRKHQIKHFSYRFFARKSGFKSPNFLKLVSSGQRNLSYESIGKIAAGFSLKSQEQEYFEYLVLMNQAVSHDDKNKYYKKMMSIKGFGEIKKIEKAGYEYFSKWYFPIIREIIMFGSRKQTPEDIAPLLNPPITAAEAKKAIDLLMTLELVKKDEDGCWEQQNRDLTTGAEVQSLVVANFHREMLRLAQESLERYKGKERDITALVLSVNHRQMDNIKEKTAAFRKELLKLASEEKDPDLVMQVSIQVFPLTQKLEGGRRC